MGHRGKTKYRVFTVCRSCGAGYETRAKNQATPPQKCKYCGSSKTRKLDQRKA